MAFTSHRIAALAAFFAALATSPAAFAHAHLKGQFPAANATLSAAPQALTLTFSEGIEPGFSGVAIAGPQQTVIKTGKAKLNDKDSKQLIVPLEESLQPGDYRVNWHVVSVDGHKTKGSYSFSVK